MYPRALRALTHTHTHTHAHKKPSNRMWLEFGDGEGRSFTVIPFYVFSFSKYFLRYLNILLSQKIVITKKITSKNQEKK